jgi:hypothetical protein
MKKIIALLACLAMLLSMAACANTTNEPETTTEPTEEVTEPIEEVTEPAEDEVTEPAATEGTVGETLTAVFKANATATAQEIADLVISNPIIQFMPATMPMEAGYLSGFGEVEITGFEECVMFGPMIGTIPFIGYVFTLAEGADVEAFKTLLTDNANLRWNICTAAEELVVESEGNTVFFLMCPASFEQPEEGGDIGGMDMLPEEGEGIVLG